MPPCRILQEPNYQALNGGPTGQPAFTACYGLETM